MAYKTIIGAGFKDAWLQATKGKETPYTCCLKTPTANDKPPFPGDHRIDHILIKGKKIKGKKATVVGTDPKNRTSTGLWPSDHGGWVSSLRLSRSSAGQPPPGNTQNAITAYWSPAAAMTSRWKISW